MSSVGEILRRERLRSGLDLEKIAQDTKIPVRTLELIEANQFEKLPGGVFARSFVRQYARVVGLDEDEITRELAAVLEPKAEPTVVAEAPEYHVPRVASWGSSRRMRPSSWLPAFALVVLVMLACSAAYTWWSKSRRNPAGVSAPAVATTTPASTSTPAANLAPKTEAPAAIAAAPAAPVAAAPAAEMPTATVSADARTGAVHIALTAAEPTWVQAKASGKVVFSGILQPNETKSLDAGDTVTLRIGNAGGLAITFNGKAIPAVGPKGQVRVVQLSPDGAVQVVNSPPKPPSPQPTQTTL